MSVANEQLLLPTFTTEPQWFIVRSWLDNQEWGDEPPDPDDVWAVGDRVSLKNSTTLGTVQYQEQQPFLGGYLPYILVLWDDKDLPIPIEPEQLVRITRYIPPGLTWKASESFSDFSSLEFKVGSCDSVALTQEHPKLTAKASYKTQEVRQPVTFSTSTYCLNDSKGLSHPNGAGSIDKSLLVGIENSPSKCRKQAGMYFGQNSPSNDIPTSKNSPSKNRRNRGKGNGTIHWRTITKNGKDYPQAYYHWKQNGQKRSKYIPKHLLEVVQQAESQKRPVIEILEILGVYSASGSALLVGTDNSPSNADEELIHTSKYSPSTQSESLIPTSKHRQSKTRRNKGLGTGSIQWKTITLNGKDYPQPWYHYEVWEGGDRVKKKSKYIPKRLVKKIQELEAQKAPVFEILEVLGVKIIHS